MMLDIHIVHLCVLCLLELQNCGSNSQKNVKVLKLMSQFSNIKDSREETSLEFCSILIGDDLILKFMKNMNGVDGQRDNRQKEDRMDRRQPSILGIPVKSLCYVLIHFQSSRVEDIRDRHLIILLRMGTCLLPVAASQQQVKLSGMHTQFELQCSILLSSLTSYQLMDFFFFFSFSHNNHLLYIKCRSSRMLFC